MSANSNSTPAVVTPPTVAASAAMPVQVPASDDTIKTVASIAPQFVDELNSMKAMLLAQQEETRKLREQNLAFENEKKAQLRALKEEQDKEFDSVLDTWCVMANTPKTPEMQQSLDIVKNSGDGASAVFKEFVKTTVAANSAQQKEIDALKGQLSDIIANQRVSAYSALSAQQNAYSEVGSRYATPVQPVIPTTPAFVPSRNVFAVPSTGGVTSTVTVAGQRSATGAPVAPAPVVAPTMPEIKYDCPTISGWSHWNYPNANPMSQPIIERHYQTIKANRANTPAAMAATSFLDTGVFPLDQMAMYGYAPTSSDPMTTYRELHETISEDRKAKRTRHY